MKHFLYFLYILGFPLRSKFATLPLFILAHVCSLAQQSLWNKKKEWSFFRMILSDEESMHFYWFFMYILLNWQYKLVVDLMFMTWAILNTCEWFDYIAQRHPGVPIVPLFSGLV